MTLVSPGSLSPFPEPAFCFARLGFTAFRPRAHARGAAFSPTGQVVSLAEDLLWIADFAAGEATAWLPTGQESGELAGVSRENRAVLYRGGQDGRLWSVDLSTGQRGPVIVPPHGPTLVALGKDGLVFAAGHSSFANIYDIHTGQLHAELPCWTGPGALAPGEPIHGAAFSPDGAFLALALTPGIELWDLRSGERKGRLMMHRGQPRCAAWSPDGRWLFAAGYGGLMKIEVASFREEQRLLIEREAGQSGNLLLHKVLCVQGGSLLVALRVDNRLCAWSTEALEPRYTLALPDLGTALAVAPHSHEALVALSGGRLTRVNLERGALVDDTPPLYRASDVHLAADGTATVLRLGTGVEIFRESGPTLVRCTDIHTGALTPDGSAALLPLGANRSLRTVDLSTKVATPLAHDRAPVLVAAGPGGRVAQASYTQVFIGENQVKWSSQDQIVRGLWWSPDGHTLAVALGDAWLVLVDASTATERTRSKVAHASSVVFLEDGSQVVSNRSESLYVIPVEDPGKKIRKRAPGEVASLALTPSGSLLAAGLLGGQVALWSLPGWKLLAQFQAAAGPVTALTFSPDGARVLTAGEEAVARIWEVGDGLAGKQRGGQTSTRRRPRHGLPALSSGGEPRRPAAARCASPSLPHAR